MKYNISYIFVLVYCFILACAQEMIWKYGNDIKGIDFLTGNSEKVIMSLLHLQLYWLSSFAYQFSSGSDIGNVRFFV